MKPVITPKGMAVWFVVVLALYLGVFYGIEYWNHRNGPWEVEFTSDAAGNPSLAIYQPKLGISSVEIVFSDEKVAATNLAQRVRLDRPYLSLPALMPFGEVIYEDLRTLPGVVTFNFFGHEIELLPRVLIVNKREVPWKTEMVVELSAANKPAQPPKAPKDWQQGPAR